MKVSSREKFRPGRQLDYVTNHKNKTAKTAKIGNPSKFNPMKVEAYTVYLELTISIIGNAYV